jgi:gluconate 5-dehydrogenase
MDYYGTVEQIFSIANKKALVTGGAKGLGRAVTTAYLENGCDVFIADLDVSQTRDLVELADSKGCKCIPYTCDVTDEKAVVEMVRKANESLGGIDVLFNSAGIAKLKPLEEMDLDSWNKTININLTAMFLMCREVSKVMAGQNSGKIINMSSIRSVLGNNEIGYSAYSASKGAVNMLTKQIACELGRYNIQCNAIAPTYIRSDINAAMLDKEGFQKKFEEKVPLGRIGQMKDLVNLVLFLTSHASDLISGQVILLDGGASAKL